jgi:hypothetical protein
LLNENIFPFLSFSFLIWLWPGLKNWTNKIWGKVWRLVCQI